MRRTHIEPFPKTRLGILLYVRRALAQTQVQRVEITSKGIVVEREMQDAELPVVPMGTDEVDALFILDNIDMTAYPFDPATHPMYVLYGAMREIHKTLRDVQALMVPGWPVLAAWLGIEEDKEPPTHVFGAKVVFVPASTTNSRIVVLGAPPGSLFLSDSDMGITIDMGV